MYDRDKNLVEELKRRADELTSIVGTTYALREAADRITQLSRELDALRQEAKALKESVMVLK